MQIHVARQSAQIGIFTVEEIQAGLISGRFLLSDLAWRDGMATWVALGDWPEFRSVVPPSPTAAANPTAAAATPVNAEVTVPWEKEKSPKSYFATLKGAILTPRETFAVGRFEFGNYLIFAYITTLLTLPAMAYSQIAQGDMFKQLGEQLQQIHNPFFDGMAKSFLQQGEQPKFIAIIGIVVAAMFGPLIPAFFGVLDWIGYKILRRSVTVERAVVAGLVGAALFNVIYVPVALLTGSPVLYFGSVLLFFIPGMIISCRAKGAIAGVGAWWAFFASFIIILLFSCCCVCTLGVLVALLAKSFAG